MTLKDIRAIVLDLVAERIDDAEARAASLRSDAGADATFVELQVDSLSTLDLCLALERTFGVPVEPAHLVRYPSVNALSRYIESGMPPRS